MIFALPPPPPLPLRCNIRRGNRCNLPPCVLRVFRGVCSLSDPLPFQKENWKPKKNFSIYSLYAHYRGGGGGGGDVEEEGGGAKSINKTRHFRSVVNYVIFRIYTRKLDSTRRFVLYLRDLSSFFIAVPSSSSFSRHFSHKDPLFLASQPTRNYWFHRNRFFRVLLLRVHLATSPTKNTVSHALLQLITSVNHHRWGWEKF